MPRLSHDTCFTVLSSTYVGGPKRPRRRPTPPPDPATLTLLRYEDAARLARLSAKTIQRAISRGELPYVQPTPAPQSRRIRREDLDRWLSSHAPKPVQPRRKRRTQSTRLPSPESLAEAFRRARTGG